MYRDDDVARTERASSLIDEIAGLERKKVSHAATDHRLDEARRELAALQAPTPEAPPRPPSVIVHLVVFGVTAGAAYLGYTLLI
jgi:hypothetical protein